MRTIIDIPDEQLKHLSALCEKQDISRSEAIRRAIALYVEEKKALLMDKKALREAAYGLWSDRDIDGVEYQRRLRAEWDRESDNVD